MNEADQNKDKEKKEEQEEQTQKEVVEKVEAKKEPQTNLAVSPFVTEEDLFDVKVDYYREGKKMVVQGVDDDYDKKKAVASVEFKVKYPSQGDCDIIAEQGRVQLENSGVPDQINIREFMKLEFVRFLCLVREWNLDKEINNTNIMSLHPSIIRAALLRIREELATEGIV
jgi:hypothetical protein